MERTCLKCGAVNPDARGFATDACPACDAIYAKLEAARMFRTEATRPTTSTIERPARIEKAPASAPVESTLARESKHLPHKRSPLGVIGVGFLIIVGAQIFSAPTPPTPTAEAPPPVPKAVPTPAYAENREPTHPAGDGKLRVQGADRIGCTSRDDYRTLTSLASSGDMDAFKAAYAIAIVGGACTRFIAGEELYLEDTAFLSGLMQVRKYGKLDRYWTAVETAR